MNKNFIDVLKKTKYMILVVLSCGCYAGIVCNQTMPLAEGWYTYYAQCINSGEIVYKDFDYLFTPLYINFIGLFTKIFGYRFIYLRLLGVLFFCVIGVVIFLIIKEIFDEKIAVVAAVTATLFMQSEVVQVFYDYVRMMDIFACTTILFLVKYIKSIKKSKKANIYLVLAGVTNAFFVLVKQNMGLVFWAYALVLICAVSIVLRESIKIFLKREISFIIEIGRAHV